MKVISTLTLIAVFAAIMAPKQAMAGDKEKAIIGGLIGGIIIGAVIADDNDHQSHVTVSHHRRYGHRHEHRDSGHWEWVTEKRWVPGYYERGCDRYGRRTKVWISGHYNYVKKKVWVSHHRSYRHSDRYDRRDRYEDRRYKRDYDRRDHDRERRSDRRNSSYEYETQVVSRF